MPPIVSGRERAVTDAFPFESHPPSGGARNSDLGRAVALFVRSASSPLAYGELERRLLREGHRVGLLLVPDDIAHAITAARAHGLRILGTGELAAVPLDRGGDERREALRSARAVLRRLGQRLGGRPGHTEARLRAEVATCEPLTTTEELELLRRVEEGDRDALGRLVESRLGLVLSIAGSVRAPGFSLSDLFQEGAIGLMRAIEKFDPDKGNLSVYATRWIRHSISRAVANKSRMVRVPVHVIEKLNRLKAAESRLAASDQPISLSQLAEDAGMSFGEAVDVRADTGGEPISLEGIRGREWRNGAILDDCEWLDGAFAELRARALDRVLATLPAREEQVVRRRRGIGCSRDTLDEIGIDLGVTRERVRQIEGHVLKKLANVELLRSFMDPESEHLEDASQPR